MKPKTAAGVELGLWQEQGCQVGGGRSWAKALEQHVTGFSVHVKLALEQLKLKLELDVDVDVEPALK